MAIKKDEGYKAYKTLIKRLKYWASRQDPTAQYDLAIEYYHGSGYQEPNIKKAQSLFKKAKENGNQDAEAFIITEENYKEFYDKAVSENNEELAKYIFKKYIKKEKLPF